MILRSRRHQESVVLGFIRLWFRFNSEKIKRLGRSNMRDFASSLVVANGKDMEEAEDDGEVKKSFFSLKKVSSKVSC